MKMPGLHRGLLSISGDLAVDSALASPGAASPERHGVSGPGQVTVRQRTPSRPRGPGSEEEAMGLVGLATASRRPRPGCLIWGFATPDRMARDGSAAASARLDEAQRPRAVPSGGEIA